MTRPSFFGAKNLVYDKKVPLTGGEVPSASTKCIIDKGGLSMTRRVSTTGDGDVKVSNCGFTKCIKIEKPEF